VKNPWWIPPFLGRVPDIEPHHVRLLGIVSLALFFESYDVSMITSALKFIAEDLDMAEENLGFTLGAIRAGAIPAVLLVPFIDRLGRRRVFLATVVGSALGTFATAFARTEMEFLVAQLLVRPFFVTGAAVATVIIAEEFPAQYRGWGLGMAGALAAFGHGAGALLFSAIDWLPGGWRFLYLIGVVPLVFFGRFRRGIPETARFEAHRERAAATAEGIGLGWHRPVVALVRGQPLRAAGVFLVALLFAVGDASVFQYTGLYTQTVHGWTPGQYATMVIVGGAVGIIGNVVAGRLGDRHGRRFVGAVFLGIYPLFAWLFYRGAEWMLPLAWTGFIFCVTAGWVIARALSTELFPTAYRGTAAGVLAFAQSLGWAAGLALVGALSNAFDDLARATSLVAFVTLGAAALLLTFPETSRRELEATSGET
jgi:putative MFS transporter